jgi:type IV pilus assembly protein PilA
MEVPAVTRRLPRLVRDERGFTLIELLITILIIGILAGISIAVFASQSKKGDDATAKSAARNLVSYMDSCYVKDEDFTKCATQADSEASDVDWGTNPGQVAVTDSDKDSYEVTAVSEATSNGSNHVFVIDRSIGNGADRTCSGSGGCRNGKW